MRTFIFALLFFFCESLAAAQHKVKLFAEGNEAEPVVSALKARLNATERYQSFEGFGSEFILTVGCTDLKDYGLKGVVCAYEFEFAPLFASSFFVPIGAAGGLAQATDSTHVAEMIFQAFVNATTEREIHKAEKDFKTNVSMFCKEKENAAVCRP